MKLQQGAWSSTGARAHTGRGTTATGHGAALILSVYYTYRAIVVRAIVELEHSDLRRSSCASRNDGTVYVSK